MQMPDKLDGMETVLKKEKRPSRIAHISWDRMEVGGLAVGKDFDLHTDGERAWNLGRTEARHSPGIQPADTEELVARTGVRVRNRH